jgi:hypothetical protein
LTSSPAIRIVMPGHVPGIDVFGPFHQPEDVDGRDKRGHDARELRQHTIEFAT